MIDISVGAWNHERIEESIRSKIHNARCDDMQWAKTRTEDRKSSLFALLRRLRGLDLFGAAELIVQCQGKRAAL